MYDDTRLFDCHNIYAHIWKIWSNHLHPTCQALKALTSNLGASSSKSWRQRSWNPKSACRNISRRPRMTQEFSSSEVAVLFFTSNVYGLRFSKFVETRFRLLQIVNCLQSSFIHDNITMTPLHPEAVCFRKQKTSIIQKVKFPQISPSSYFKSYHALPFPIFWYLWVGRYTHLCTVRRGKTCPRRS